MSVKHVKQCGNCPLHQYVAEKKTTVCSETGKCIVTHHARNRTCPFDFFDHPVSETSVETILSLMASGKKWLNWHTWPNVQAAYRKLCADAIAAIPPCPNAGEGRGIVIVGGGRYFISALTNIRLIRKLGCTLPILLVGLDGELPDWQRQLVAPHGATCATWSELAPDHPRGKDHGWELKTVAALYSPFAQSLHLDADSFPQSDPTFLFEDPHFTANGAVFWPDLPDVEKDPKKRYLMGDNMPAEVWEMLGVPARDIWALESGQQLVDKARWWRALWLSNWICQKGWDFYFKLPSFYGDKNCAQVAGALLGIEYASPPFRPYTGAGDGTCSPNTAPMLLQRDFDNKPLFAHYTHPKFWLDWKDRKPFKDIPLDPLTIEIFKAARFDLWHAQPKPYIVGITVCVGYDDYLLACIENKKYLDDWLIVTSPDDQKTLDLCHAHGLWCITSDRLHYADSRFNLGALRNDGAEAVAAKYPGHDDLWALYLDGDCRLPEDFRRQVQQGDLDRKNIIGAHRRNSDGMPCTDVGVTGFFQLFHLSQFPDRKYQDDHYDAGGTDCGFRDLWPKREQTMLGLTVEHLGRTGVDWDGRKSPPYDPAKPMPPDFQRVPKGDHRKPIPLTPARIAHGAVGIAKAKLHIDRAPDEVIAQRKAICAACPNNVPSFRHQSCRLCGCNLGTKLVIRSEQCPDSPPRWPAVPPS